MKPLFAQDDTPMSGVDYPLPVQTLRLEHGYQLAYTEQAGTGPCLLFVHGLGSYLPSWLKVLQALPEDQHAIALDLPGYGKSSVPGDSISLPFYARTLSRLVETIGLREVVLVGHSMGGQIALSLALEKPDWLKGLVLLAPAGFETFSAQDRDWFRQFVTPETLLAASPQQIRANFDVNFFGGKLPEDAEFMYRDRLQLREDSLHYRAYCERVVQSMEAMLQYPVYERLPEIDLPTLVVFGEDDLLIPNRLLHPQSTTEEVARTGTGSLRSGQLEMLADCGHFVLWDQAEEVAKLIGAFLEKHGRP